MRLITVSRPRNPGAASSCVVEDTDRETWRPGARWARVPASVGGPPFPVASRRLNSGTVIAC